MRANFSRRYRPCDVQFVPKIAALRKALLTFVQMSAFLPLVTLFIDFQNDDENNCRRNRLHKQVVPFSRFRLEYPCWQSRFSRINNAKVLKAASVLTRLTRGSDAR